jgi:hypothetical protein
MAHAAAQALRAVRGDIEVGEPLTEVPPRSAVGHLHATMVALGEPVLSGVVGFVPQLGWNP